MRLQVEGHLGEALETAGLEAGAGRVEPDPDDMERGGWNPIRTTQTGKAC